MIWSLWPCIKSSATRCDNTGYLMLTCKVGWQASIFAINIKKKKKDNHMYLSLTPALLHSRLEVAGLLLDFLNCRILFTTLGHCRKTLANEIWGLRVGAGAFCGLFSHLKGRWSLRVCRGPLATGRLGFSFIDTPPTWGWRRFFSYSPIKPLCASCSHRFFSYLVIQILKNWNLPTSF